jgi:hypothetical protein
MTAVLENAERPDQQRAADRSRATPHVTVAGRRMAAPLETRALVLSLQRSAGNRATTELLRARPLLQRKGAKPLATQIATSTPAGLAAWASTVETRPDAEFAAIMQRIRDYDALADGRPSAQLAHLDATHDALRTYISRVAPTWDDEELGRLSALTMVVNDERATVTQQQMRLERYTRDANAPYEQMTAEGMLWTHPEWAKSATTMKLKGRRYFDALSAENRKWMQGQLPGSFLFGPEKWVVPMLAKVRAALESAVLNHYTTAARAQLMLTGGGLKSKMMLAKDVAGYHHNTSAYDDYGLANTGFLFFFIEASGTPMRDTRFAQGGKDEGPSSAARISIPIQESGLLTNGWVMLSDFAQREFPTVLAKPEAPTETFSELPTRLEKAKAEKGKGFDLPVRHFEQGVVPVGEDEMIRLAERQPDSERRQAQMNVTAQVRGDAQSAMVYGKNERYAERLAQNVLVGPDIIPGLAERAVVEISRIAKSNPALAQKIKSMDGPPLLRFLLKDLLRPQAMVPNRVAIEERHIEPPPPKAIKEEAVELVTPPSAHGPPGRAELMKQGLADLEAIAEEWRKRGNPGDPPGYHDRRAAFQSIAIAPPEITIEQIQEDTATWLRQARDAWLPSLASGVLM